MVWWLSDKKLVSFRVPRSHGLDVGCDGRVSLRDKKKSELGVTKLELDTSEQHCIFFYLLAKCSRGYPSCVYLPWRGLYLGSSQNNNILQILTSYTTTYNPKSNPFQNLEPLPQSSSSTPSQQPSKLHAINKELSPISHNSLNEITLGLIYLKVCWTYVSILYQYNCNRRTLDLLSIPSQVICYCWGGLLTHSLMVHVC